MIEMEKKQRMLQCGMHFVNMHTHIHITFIAYSIKKYFHGDVLNINKNKAKCSNKDERTKKIGYVGISMTTVTVLSLLLHRN